VWRRETVIGAILGALVGLDAAWVSGLNVGQTIPSVLATAAGLAALSLALAPRVRDPILSTWALGGALFFFTVRFAATRYWAAFLPGVGLLAFRNAQRSLAWIAAGISINVLLSLGIAIDDQCLAQSWKDAAQRVASHGTGTFSGHWGWQHYLEKEGWTPIERGGQPGKIHAIAVCADAQMPDSTACLRLMERFPLVDPWPGPRVYSWYNHAFYHAGVRGRYPPWILSDEPYDMICICRRCDTDSGDVKQRREVEDIN
jgi:hypothetical protein